MQEERAHKTLADLSASIGGADEERVFLKDGTNSAPPSGVEAVVKELKKNWWMWGTVAFVVILLGGLFVFRDSLYTSEARGLPMLAVAEDAQEACTTECTDELDKLKSKPDAAIDDAKSKEIYDSCYSKCIVEEKKEVLEERTKYKKEEEEAEKEEEKEKKEEEAEKKEKKEKDEDEDENETKGRRRFYF